MTEDGYVTDEAQLLHDVLAELREMNARFARLEQLGTKFAGKNGKVLLALLSARTGGRR